MLHIITDSMKLEEVILKDTFCKDSLQRLPSVANLLERLSTENVADPLEAATSLVLHHKDFW